MIRSMTGYGRAEAADDNRRITVEIRIAIVDRLDLNSNTPVIIGRLCPAVGSPTSYHQWSEYTTHQI